MKSVLIVLALGLVVSISGTGTAAVPQTLSYQGALTDETGSVVADGNYNVTFHIYSVVTGGSPLWSETQNLPVEDGILNATLGAVMFLDLPFDVPYWLAIQIDGGAELAPRTELTSAPYALRAAVADVGADDDWESSGNDIYRLTGNVGIGTSSPTEALEVVGTARVDGIEIPTGAADGYVLTSDVSGTGSWQPSPAGDITAVHADAGLTGGATSGEAHLSVGPGTGVVVAADQVSVDVSGLAGDGLANVGETFGVTPGTGLEVTGDAVQLTPPYQDGSAYDGVFVNEGQADAVTTAMTVPDIVSSVDGVANDGGDIDLVAGSNITITPDDGANTITIDALAADDGDWTVSGENIYRATGYVGIGTSAPNCQLQIHQPLAMSSAIQLTNQATGAGGADGLALMSWMDGSASLLNFEGGKLGLGTWMNWNLVIDGSGRVGINTSNPTSRLDVDGTAKMTGFTLPTGASSGLVLTSDGGGTGTWQPVSAPAPASIDGVSNDGGDVDLVEGSNITITPDDGANTITISAEDAIGGSGTNGYIPKFTGTGTLTNSSMLDVGGVIYLEGSRAGRDVPDGGYDEPEFERGRAGNLLYASGYDGASIYSEVFDFTAGWASRAAFYGMRYGNSLTPGTGYASGLTSAAVIGRNDRGDEYTFGVVGYSMNDDTRTGGVFGANDTATYWGALGYKDEDSGTWGVYTPQNSYTGGTARVDGTCDVNGLLDVDRYATRVGDFASDYPSSGTHVVHAEYTGTSSYDAVAVYGESTPADNWGVGGEFYGSYIGVRGMVSLISGGASYFGVYGRTQGTLGAGGSMYGVRGVANASGSPSGTAIGVYGNASGAAGNYAGYFAGDVVVTGTLSKGGGSFRIDHPLDPENKYLCHSFVESPDMKNVYDGVVRLDSAGEAWVELPEWFETLNRDFRYQLTCIGGFAPVYIAEELSENRFKIAGGNAGMKVSWQLTGIRQDKFADANRIKVEEDKPAEHIGKYIHPEAYGLPETMFINYEEPREGKQE